MDRRGILSADIKEIQNTFVVEKPQTEKKNELEEELDFYKSLFQTHQSSVLFNLHIKKKDGKNVWVDPIRDNREYLESLDRDEDVEEWLKPVRPSR